ncbi:MAG: 2-oxo-4-hydroxy-4-carboxy-5-ureidoimidazoline decarboxylase [Burkholderiaceae bacterium]
MTLDELNQAPFETAVTYLDGVYEHSPWIAENALKKRPFKTLAALKQALIAALDAGGREAKLTLIRAHPELAGKAMIAQSLTAESTNEQQKAGLTQCTPTEFAHIQSLNRDYNERFGFPFILAVRGPRGEGLSKSQIIAAFERRLKSHPDFEVAECIRNIHRIAEIRLNDKFNNDIRIGETVWDWHEDLAQHTDPDYVDRGQLTVTYLTPAHQRVAQSLRERMLACGFDRAEIDAVGNVVGIYEADREQPNAKTLMTGSHYDTVRNGGKYDGRLGILVPMACVQQLHAAGQRLPFGLEVVGFAEEEGQRYKAAFLGSSALVGNFDMQWLAQTDANGVRMEDAMRDAGLDPNGIAALKRDPSRYLGFVEVHIEQGPVLCQANQPLGVVSAINGSVRWRGEVRGTASHAGTTPMGQRADAAMVLAEWMVALEARASADGDSVATVGMLEVPSGSINVVPGRCTFSLDIRAPRDDQRDALANDALALLHSIAARRGAQASLEEVLRASAAPSDATWQQHWRHAVQAVGLKPHVLPSGAGHDAMMLHHLMPQAMLFVRGENLGISHNPLESTTSDDMQLAIDAMMHLLGHLNP